MHKREVLLSLMTLLAAYVLLLFIGLAGPNVDKVNSVMAKEMMIESNINDNYTAQLLSYGPFVVTTPALSPYSQQLSLYLTFSLQNEESSEAFHKDFDIIIDMDGISANNNQTLVCKCRFLNRKFKIFKISFLFFQLAKGRFQAVLYCGGRRCEPIRAIRLIKIEYQHYRINLTFNRLQSVNEKYIINDILFEFRSVNVSFTTLSIWFRFFFLMITFIVMCSYMHNLYRFSFYDWSLEQKWTAAQLLLLILSNNPFYPIQFLFGCELPYLLEVWLHTSLQTLIMLFWLCFFHGIRQNKRTLSKFYASKLIIVGTIWFTAIYTMSWSLRNQIYNPILDENSAYNHSILLQVILSFFLNLKLTPIFLLHSKF